MDETMKLGLVSSLTLFCVAMSCGGPEPESKSPVIVIGDEPENAMTQNNANADPAIVQTSCGECPRPRPWCDGNSLVAHEVGCVDGACSLGEEASTDCEAAGQICSDGACVDADEVPVNNNNPDPPATCDFECPPPGAPTCRGVILQVPLDTATCNPETLRCEGETFDEIRCADTGQICANGACVDQPKRVFLTTALYDGDLATAGGTTFGIDGADAICNLEASGAQLGGTWKAWLSDSFEDAIDRLADNGPWYLVNNSTLVANNLAELATTGPRNDIIMHPNGSTMTQFGAWTGTGSGGRFEESDCNGWTTDSYEVHGRFGVDGSSRVGAWTDQSSNGDCDVDRYLYCFEQ